MQSSALHAGDAPVESQYCVDKQVEVSVEVRPVLAQVRIVLGVVVVSQKLALGAQTRLWQVPDAQTRLEAVQSVPPASYPEPSELQVVAMLPLHAAAPGVHTLALHAGDEVLESQ